MGRPKGSKNKNPRKVLKVLKKAKRVRKSEDIKKVETLQSLDFGKCDNNCYRVAVITIDEEPYIGFIKCWRGPGYLDYTFSRTRLFMPLSAWNSFVDTTLPQIKYPPLKRQLAMTGLSTRYD